ncbi:MAG TPA: hypothetical protein VF278_23825 [Pirellulales bacterium]
MIATVDRPCSTAVLTTRDDRGSADRDRDERNQRQEVRLDTPDAAWSRAELEDRADWEIGKLKRRKGCAATYWWLGNILSLVRAELEQRGEWTAWRRAHGVDRTLAQRARFFVRAFASPHELDGLPIHKADRLARQRLGLPAASTEEGQRIRRRLRQLAKKTLPDSLRDLAAMHDTRTLAPLVEDIGELFGQLYDAVCGASLEDESRKPHADP